MGKIQKKTKELYLVEGRFLALVVVIVAAIRLPVVEVAGQAAADLAVRVSALAIADAAARLGPASR